MANWIGNTLRLMLTDDRFALTLAGGRRSVGQALNEVLWEDTPGQNSSRPMGDTRHPARRAAHPRRRRDVLGLAASQLRSGDTAGPARRPGGNHAHMAFAHGEHRCPHPAPEIAEVMAQAAVEVLMDRLPDVILDGETEDLVWRPSMQMRGLMALPVTFTPAYVAGH